MSLKVLHLPRIYDAHVHLRQEEMLRNVLPHTARRCGRALVMPNLLPPILNGVDAMRYRDEIARLCENIPDCAGFELVMTIKITDNTTPAIIDDAARLGIEVAKVYPVGVTTNSDDGVSDFKTDRLMDVWRALEANNMVLCLHGERPAPTFVLDREAEFVGTVSWLIDHAPNLRIVCEHITTAKLAEVVQKAGLTTLSATITAHHLAITLDDVIGGMLKPHHFCKPVAKRPEDRRALWNAIRSGSPAFFLGSDSAPHLRGMKECSSGCAGIYTAPILLPLLATLFEQEFGSGFLESLTNFTSRFGNQFYGFPPNQGSIAIQRKPFEVPTEYHGVVPFMAGETLPWSYVEQL